MTLARAYRAAAFHWYTIESEGYEPNGHSDVVALFPDGPGGAPNTIAYEVADYAAERIATGAQFYEYDIYLNSATDLPPLMALTEPTYFIGLRSIASNDAGSYWLTAPLIDSDAYFKSADYGEPDWIAWSQISHNDPANVAFCMSGALLEIGACCFNDGACIFVSRANCQAAGGKYAGDGARCSDHFCRVTGACCLDDKCAVGSQQKCVSFGGRYMGDGTECEEHTCDPPAGACCLIAGACAVVTESVCDERSGRYLGDGTNCRPNPCSRGSSGGCCYDDGTCARISKSKCSDTGGDYIGDGVACAPNPCPQPLGACCVAEQCTRISKPQCEEHGGTFAGPDTDCAADLCAGPRGACCLSSGVCLGGCGHDLCAALGGVYVGNDTGCEPSPCDAGACCFDDGSCALLAAGDCAQENGAFQGGGTTCQDTLCPCTARGDANCDLQVDFDDIECFVAALIGETQWNNCGGSSGCSYLCSNDIDRSGAVDFDDIDEFVVCLINGQCP